MPSGTDGGQSVTRGTAEAISAGETIFPLSTGGGEGVSSSGICHIRRVANPMPWSGV